MPYDDQATAMMNGYDDDDAEQDLASKLGRFGSARSQFNQSDPGTVTPKPAAPKVVDMSAQIKQPSVLGRPPKPMLGAIPNSGDSTNPTGQDQTPLGMKLATIGKPPAPPSMNPDYDQTLQHRAKISMPTAKYDAQGNVLPQYKMGIGGRLARMGTDLLRGGVFGLGRDALDPTAPGYYGKNAVSNQYNRDEATRQGQVQGDDEKLNQYRKQFEDKEKDYGHQLTSYNDETRRAYDQARTEETAAHNQAMETLKQQLQDAKDPAAKAQAEANARATLADQFKLTPKERNSYVLTGKLPDDDYKQQQLILAQERLGLMRDRLDLERDKAAKAGAQKPKDYTALRVNAEKTKNAELDKLEKQFARDFANANEDNKTKDALTAALNQNKARVQKAYEAELAQIPTGEQKPPLSQQATPQRPAAAPQAQPTAGAQGLPQPIAPVRLEAHNSDGSPAQAVVVGRDSKGRETYGIKPNPGTPAPTQKTATKAEVQAYATKRGIPPAQAEQQLQASGYTIR